MLRQGHRGVVIDGVMVPTKIRKRGSSSTSSSSSRVYNYRLNKRAILVGKNRAGLGIGPGRSRSSTPAPAWRTAALRGAVDSPKFSQSGKSTRPVSARKLAATLWEMNEMPSPEMSEVDSEVINRRRQQQQKKNGGKIVPKREKMQPVWGLHTGSGYLPPHLSDPSHSPTISEKMDRSGTGSRHRRRTPSISQMLMSAADRNIGVHDSISNASFMEVETRSRPQTSNSSVTNSRNRLKDISNALTTSKELLKIITRVWAQAGPPSSSLSLVSALHAELERARLQVNHLIQEPRSTEEKTSLRIKEQQAVEAAVGPIVDELAAERKSRRRVESLNKKLGIELAETKSSFVELVKELEREKRAREITERVCDELARNMDEDRAEVEKEREMLQLADKLREERVQMKLSEARHQFEEKNSAVSKLRKQLEVFLGTKNKHELLEDEDDDDDMALQEDSSVESELHSIELNKNNNNNNNNKGYKWSSQKMGSLRRSVSDGVERGFRGEDFHEVEKEASRSGCVEEGQGVNKSVKGIKDRILLSSRFASSSSSNQKEQSWPSRDPCGGTLEERSSVVQTTSSKSKSTGVVRRSKR
ncbi:hypothetical protein ACP275_10G085600 [Erythranthe tilingii]